LRFVQLLSAGYERLQDAGVPEGVMVANAGHSWSPAVAEHAMAMLLTLVKRLPRALASQARREWDRSYMDQMGTLHGRTLAIVGFGSIGKEFARLAKAFGMHVIALSRSGRPDPLADEVKTADQLNDFLTRADVILLSVPSTRRTRGLIGEAELARCRPGAILINVCRGDVVDSRALVEALDAGRLGAAGLDVTDPEPPPGGSALWDAPNLLITAHVSGAAGHPGRVRLAAFVADNIGRFAAGETPLHLVNVSVHDDAADGVPLRRGIDDTDKGRD